MRPYVQTTEYTTAAAGLVTILNHFNKDFALTSENELAIWHASVLLPTRASSIFGLAFFAKKHGLSPRIVVEQQEYDYPDYRFKRYKKTDIDLAQRSHEIHVAAAKDASIPIEQRTITFSEVKELVYEGNVLLIRLNEGTLRRTGSTSKYVVVYGYENKKFLVLDPLQKQPLLVVDEATLEESFTTLTTKKKRDHRMIVFSSS